MEKTLGTRMAFATGSDRLRKIHRDVSSWTISAKQGQLGFQGQYLKARRAGDRKRAGFWAVQSSSGRAISREAILAAEGLELSCTTIPGEGDW